MIMRKTTFLKIYMLLAIIAFGSSFAIAETGTLTITRASFPSGALAYNATDTWTATTSKGDIISGVGDLYSSANQETLQSKNTGVSTMYRNTTPMPGSITKITLSCASGTTRTYTAFMNKTTTITSTAGGTSKGTIAPTSGNSASLSLDASDEWKFFWLDLAGGASFLTSIVIEYEVSATTAVSTPIITPSGTPKSTDNYWITASVGLSTTTEGASIYYTTNGDAPTASSTAYTAPFDITTTTTVKAIAVKDGLDNSAVAEKTITISTPATATIPYTEAFNNTLGDWINFEVVGTKPWVASVNGALGNGYGGGDVESWLISPKFTAAGDGIALSFDYASKYVGDPIKVKMSSNYMGYGNPSTATWTELSTIAAPTVQDDAYTLKSTGSIIAPGTGTVYFALVYDVAAAPYSDWRITNAQVKAYVPAAAPTITVTENSVAAMEVVVGNTDAETVTVNGIELTDNIIVSLGGDNANMFEVSPTSLVAADGVASGSVTITYNPTAPGSHTATLKLNTVGGEEVTRALSGTATLATPVATDASGISTTGFTANWNAVPGATEYELSVYTKTVTNTPATDLFISEYVEGSSNNKYIEIFNGTGADVNLEGYKIQLYANGATTPTNNNTLSGTLVNGQTVIYKNSSAALTLNEGVTATTNTAMNFGGNDALALYKISTESFVDIFGRIGNDPGTAWTADGGYSTQDKTLRRKSTVSGGITVSPTGTGVSGFATLATEWDLYDQNTISDLGSHTYSGQSVSVTPLAGSPFTVVGETSKALSSLTEGTNYYYKVIAKNGTTVTAVSNEIKATTSLDTYIQSLPTGMHLRSVNGNILFNAEANQTVEVYNAIGQKLITRTTTTGLNSIPVKVKGVVFVKLGTEVSKLIVE